MFKTNIGELRVDMEVVRDKFLRAGPFEQGKILGAIFQQIDERLEKLESAVLDDVEEVIKEDIPAQTEEEIKEEEVIEEDKGE